MILDDIVEKRKEQLQREKDIRYAHVFILL